MTLAFFIGNLMAIKRRVKTPLEATIFGELDSKTDRLKRVFNMGFRRSATTGQAIYDNPDIGLPSFTGSVDTRVLWWRWSKISPKSNSKRTGNAAAIVAGGVDPDHAVGAILALRNINTGQVCNCAGRVLCR